jgi:hypothetical protein
VSGGINKVAKKPPSFPALKKMLLINLKSRAWRHVYQALLPPCIKNPSPSLENKRSGLAWSFCCIPRACPSVVFYVTFFASPQQGSTLHPQAECNKLRNPSKQKNQAASNHHHQLPLRHKKTTQSHIKHNEHYKSTHDESGIFLFYVGVL